MASRRVKSAEGERIQLGTDDDYILFKVFAEETQGRFEQYLKHLPSCTLGADMHVHANTDQYFAVLSGELILGTMDGEVALGPGDIFVVERGAPHSERNDSDDHTEVLISFAPARRHHLFFQECARVAHLPLEQRLAEIAKIRRRFWGFSCDPTGAPSDGLPPSELE